MGVTYLRGWRRVRVLDRQPFHRDARKSVNGGAKRGVQTAVPPSGSAFREVDYCQMHPSPPS